MVGHHRYCLINTLKEKVFYIVKYVNYLEISITTDNCCHRQFLILTAVAKQINTLGQYVELMQECLFNDLAISLKRNLIIHSSEVVLFIKHMIIHSYRRPERLTLYELVIIHSYRRPERLTLYELMIIHSIRSPERLTLYELIIIYSYRHPERLLLFNDGHYFVTECT